MVILHSLIKIFKLEVYLIIVLFSLLLLPYTLFKGLLLSFIRLWLEVRDVSDILGICGAWGVTHRSGETQPALPCVACSTDQMVPERSDIVGHVRAAGSFHGKTCRNKQPNY